MTVLNEVVLNQVLVRFDGPDERTRALLDAVRRDGTCFMSGTTWRGRAAMRISVSNWSTDEDDVDASVRAILKIAEQLRWSARWWRRRCASRTSRPKSFAGSRQTECAWLAPRWVLSHSTSRLGPCTR